MVLVQPSAALTQDASPQQSEEQAPPEEPEAEAPPEEPEAKAPPEEPEAKPPPEEPEVEAPPEEPEAEAPPVPAEGSGGPASAADSASALPEQQELSPAEVALLAQQVHTEHCAPLYGDDRALAGEGYAVVGPAWAKVSVAFRQSGEAYLLYWSGLLSECLGREADAVDDLNAFVSDEKSVPLVSMLADAKWRLRRRARAATKVAGGRSRVGGTAGASAAARFIPAVVLGVVSGLGVAATAVQWEEASSYHIPQMGDGGGGLPRAVLEDHLFEVRGITERVVAFGAVSAGLGLGSVLSAVLARASLRGPRGRPAAVDVSVGIAPDLNGAGLELSGRW